MSVALAPFARLLDADLKVEAGATVETRIVVGPLGDDADRDLSVRIEGLPKGWYSLSAESLRVPAGGRSDILLVFHPPREDSMAELGEYEYLVALDERRSGESARIAGRALFLPAGGATMRSRLLEYLPAVYRSDPFVARFLLIFESIVDPIEAEIGNTHAYFDPDLAPARFLPWLASWLDVTLEPGLDESGQRALIRRAVELHRWKGTRRGVREELRLRTGARPLIVENFDGMRLGQDAALGLNTNLGVRKHDFIAVTLAADDPAALDERRADELVGEVKPAHVGHVTRAVRAPIPASTSSPNPALIPSRGGANG